MKIEINEGERKLLKNRLEFHLDFGLNDGDFEMFQVEAGGVLTKKEFEKEVNMVKKLLKDLK